MTSIGNKTIGSVHGWRGRDRGAVALITVIILGSMLFVLGITAARLGQTDIIIAGQMDRGQHALTRSVACAEEALHRLKLDSAYSGGTITVGDVECSVTVVGSGAARTVTAAATSGDHGKTVEIAAALSQNAAGNARTWSIDSWTEIDP